MKEKRSLGFAHHFPPTYPDFLHAAPPTPACAAFIKESRMKSINASKLDRKSGVRLGERGGTRRFPSNFVSQVVEFLSIQIGTAGSGDANILA
jgi:hypothetical protein